MATPMTIRDRLLNLLETKSRQFYHPIPEQILRSIRFSSISKGAVETDTCSSD